MAAMKALALTEAAFETELKDFYSNGNRPIGHRQTVWPSSHCGY